MQACKKCLDGSLDSTLSLPLSLSLLSLCFSLSLSLSLLHQRGSAQPLLYNRRAPLVACDTPPFPTSCQSPPPPHSPGAPCRVSGYFLRWCACACVDVDGNRSSGGVRASQFAPWRTVAPLKARGWKRGWMTTWSSRAPILSGRRQGKEGAGGHVRLARIQPIRSHLIPSVQ